MGCFLADLRVSRARARAGQFWASAEELTVHMTEPLTLISLQVSPFTPPRRGYSGSAAVPKAGADKATFPAPAHGPDSFHHRLIERTYRTSGRRGTSPVMVRGHFPQAVTCSTRRVRPSTRVSGAGGRSGELPSASLKGGSWRKRQAEVQSPLVTLPGPFDTPPSSGPSVGDALAAYPR